MIPRWQKGEKKANTLGNFVLSPTDTGAKNLTLANQRRVINESMNTDLVDQIDSQPRGEAFQQFLVDFTRMKQKINNLITKAKVTDEKVNLLESQISKLTSENTKLNTDMKILRDEHTEVLHQLFTIDKKNSTMFRENNEIKRLMKLEDSVALEHGLTQASDHRQFMSFDQKPASRSMPITQIVSSREVAQTSAKDTSSEDQIKNLSDFRREQEQTTFGQQY